MNVSLWAIVACGAIIAAVSVVLSRRGNPLWLLDPRGVLAVVLFVNACGLPAYKLIHGEVPPIFGLEEQLLPAATLLMVTGQLGLLLGTLMPCRTWSRRLPSLDITTTELPAFVRVLVGALVISGGALWAKIAARGSDIIFNERYGASQWESQQGIPAILNVGHVCVPTLLLLIAAWGINGNSLKSRKLWFLVAYAMAPSVILGARRDTILVVFCFMLARAVQGHTTQTRHVALMLVLIIGLGYVLGLSRSGTSLAFGDRIAAVRERSAEESVVVRTITMLSGTSVMTAAMGVFPARVAFSGGRTYVETLVNVCAPRFLTGKHPFTPPGVAFRDIFYADVTGYGMDYSVAAEGYQNFGPIGPFVAYVAVGWILALSFSLASRPGDVATYWVFLHLVLLSSALWAVRTDSHTAVKLALYTAAWVMILRFVAARVLRGRGGGVSGGGRECVTS